MLWVGYDSESIEFAACEFYKSAVTTQNVENCTNDIHFERKFDSLSVNDFDIKFELPKYILEWRQILI